MIKSIPGDLQYKIMRVLWREGKQNAREITDMINKSDSVAHSTVQTVLGRMEKKGMVGHDVDNRSFIYYPLVQEDEVKQKTVDEVIHSVFSGSPEGLIAHLIKHEKMTPEMLKDIRNLIDEEDG